MIRRIDHNWDILDIILELPSNESVQGPAGVGATLIHAIVYGNDTLNPPSCNYHMIVHKDDHLTIAKAIIQFIGENS